MKYLKTADSLEILMGPPAPPKNSKEERDPRGPKRAHYQNLLGRAVITDAELDLLPDSI